MDGDWDEVTRTPFPPPPGVHSIAPVVTAMTFDQSQELLWTGNGFGRVTSFYGTELTRYSSFKAFSQSDGSVNQLLTNEKGVVALGSKDIHMSSRRGPAIWHIKDHDANDLRCMSFTSKGPLELLIAGWQDVMLVVDVARGAIVRKLPTDHHYSIMKRSRFICAATRTGTVNLLDASTFAIVGTWNAHSAVINDMDAQHDFIVTCGYSLRGGQNYMLDPFLNVFDIKNMSQTSPIPFPAGAAFVRMHPRMSTTSVVISQTGQMHVVDLVNPNTSNVRQANLFSYLNMFDIAPSGEAIALADTECNIHLWGSPSKIHFVSFLSSTEFATPEEPSPQVDWTLDTPLNAVGLPYYRETLFSAWPTIASDVGAPPTKLDPQFLSTLTSADFGLYGQNSRGIRRNLVDNTRATEKASQSGIVAPKFLSERARESAKTTTGNKQGQDATEEHNIANDTASTSSTSEIPAMYRNVEIKYSKFGVDDFDFGFYNRTNYSGLEIHISNSYANSLLQLLHFTSEIRNLALQHTVTACINDACLLCELGFLFDMLQKAEGSICQATNLLKTLSNSPQAAPLGLLEEDPHGSSMTAMLQGLARFLLDKIVGDFRSFSTNTNPLKETLSTHATSSITCMNCKSEYTRSGFTFVNDLLYPTSKPNPRSLKMPRITFSQVLKTSVERETTSKGWCVGCHKYQTMAMRKTISSIPTVLILNAAITNQEHKSLWTTPGWLPDEIGVIVEQGQFFCYEGEDLKLHLQRGIHNITVYSLIGAAISIEGGTGQKPHLISVIDVSKVQNTSSQDSQWHLFNDFLVRAVPREEALTFSAWKMPSVLCFQSKTAHAVDDSWKANINTDLLYHPVGIGADTALLLDPSTERPGPGTIIALDTEFVAVRQPEIEMNSDGERETIRPIVYALARVSVVRGQGEREGAPFIDDYITIKEPIIDYLTSYSGITADDLDRRVSKRNLVSLKVAYKRLWILVNLGCRFLGHGLKQDFRVINIHIPKAQVVDTINLFFLKSRLRKLSLAYLAWCLLKEDIQLETHDSIEDARTALKLYRKFLEFQDAGVLEAMLQDIYKMGRDVNFKPPRKDGQAVRRSDTPPLSQVPSKGPTTPSRQSATSLQGGGGNFGWGPSWTPGRG